MGKLGYVVLEYAKSELEITGVPFAVALRGDVESAVDFGMYVLQGWKNLIVAKNVWERDTVEDFLYEFHQLRFRDAAAVEDFFGSIQGLGVGPLRTTRSGMLDSATAERGGLDISSRSGEVIYWERKKFDNLIAFVLQDSCPQ